METDQSRNAPSGAGPKPWGKTDIVGFLADLRGYRRYLELATTTTGHEFGKIDRSRFPICHRLLYRCPDGFDDGLNIDFRSSGPDTAECIAAIKACGLTYDAILVDPYHDYASSRRDIEDAAGLLAPGGTIVVHDCLPPLGDDKLVSPIYVPGNWCGVTFMAYIDFVIRTTDIDYATVDTDLGCGIIQKSARASRPDAGAALLRTWMGLGEDSAAALRFVHENRDVLLRMSSVDDFVADQKRKLTIDDFRSGLAQRL
jgi:hypothetical protein